MNCKTLHVLQVSGKVASKGSAAGSRTLPRHGLKAGTSSLTNNSSMMRSTSMVMLNQVTDHCCTQLLQTAVFQPGLPQVLQVTKQHVPESYVLKSNESSMCNLKSERSTYVSMYQCMYVFVYGLEMQCLVTYEEFKYTLRALHLRYLQPRVVVLI